MKTNSSSAEGDWLDSLAQLLLVRHINNSIPGHKLREDLLATDEEELWTQAREKFRCIAIVGAGASAPALPRGSDLASGLIQKFNIEPAAVAAERERLERITAVDPSDFEAQLSAIGQTLGNSRRVQTAISDLYRVRHPTILAYELLAHLLKHRFLDAIISMNFDELLDQSLEDELGSGEYERIVSDRDCVNVQSDVFATDYVPLYIKLHGTASEPESIRFTRESYYDSPVQVGAEATRLFQIPECVVLNLGFGMTSFDLHRLLAIPDTLHLYNLSCDPLTRKARDALTAERARHEKDEPNFRESKENAEKLASEDSTSPAAPEGDDFASSVMMSELLQGVDRRVDRLSSRGSFAVSLRSVERHRAVVDLLGPESLPGQRLIRLPPNSEDSGLSLDPQARAARPKSARAGYLKRRTILELALAMARGRGLVSVATLAVDRGGLYYDAYRRCAGDNPASWKELCDLAGFKQNRKVPDIFEAMDSVRETSGPTEEELYKQYLKKSGRDAEADHSADADEPERESDWQELPRLDVPKLVERVLPEIVDSPTPEAVELLCTELEELCTGSEYEIHSRDDRVCAKTFSDNVLTLKTLSSLEAYSFDLVRKAGMGGEKTKVDIISETGEWLLNRREEIKHYMGDGKRIKLIVAFLCDVPTLREEFPGIRVKYQQPWHHNRHMVIVRERKEPRAALYFARHHRTPYITPVLLSCPTDIEVLQTTFKKRWHDATEL